MAYKPHYPLKDIKSLIKANHYRFNPNALESGHWDFGWGPTEMTKVILRLNDRWYKSNPEKNHFYKTKPHKTIPNTKMDYYKVKNGYEGHSIYTHLYIRIESGMLIISSFKEL